MYFIGVWLLLPPLQGLTAVFIVNIAIAPAGIGTAAELLVKDLFNTVEPGPYRDRIHQQVLRLDVAAPLKLGHMGGQSCIEDRRIAFTVNPHRKVTGTL